MPLPTDTRLVVFDMAGTVVDEGGVVYDTLHRVLTEAGVPVDDDEFSRWHGANKIEVIRHFLGGPDADEERVEALHARFLEAIRAAYFHPDSPVALMPGAAACLEALRGAGVRVALDTGYPREIADGLIDRLALADRIDGSVVAEEVGEGRPSPKMIRALMARFGVVDPGRVVKVGDTARDMEEGRNAACGWIVGVLSGADDRPTLEAAGAHEVVTGVGALATEGAA